MATPVSQRTISDREPVTGAAFGGIAFRFRISVGKPSSARSFRSSTSAEGHRDARAEGRGDGGQPGQQGTEGRHMGGQILWKRAEGVPADWITIAPATEADRVMDARIPGNARLTRFGRATTLWVELWTGCEVADT